MLTAEASAIFHHYLYRRSGERSTPKHYLSVLAIFLRQLGDKPVQQVTARDIDRFIDAQQQQGLAASTINRRLADFQTPDTDREEKGWQLVHLAYAQLWMARHVAQGLPRPWARSLPTLRARRTSPTLVQRDFARIIRQLGTPAQPPKRRGYSKARRKATKLAPRPRLKAIVKGHNNATSP